VCVGGAGGFEAFAARLAETSMVSGGPGSLKKVAAVMADQV